MEISCTPRCSSRDCGGGLLRSKTCSVEVIKRHSKVADMQNEPSVEAKEERQDKSTIDREISAMRSEFLNAT